jgi:hypothetical protein
MRYRAFAQVATGCVTPKKTPQAFETRDVRTTAELNLPYDSAGGLGKERGKSQIYGPRTCGILSEACRAKRTT